MYKPIIVMSSLQFSPIQMLLIFCLGKLIKRQRLPKNDVGDHWHWKDLNIGMNVTFYGKVFHLYDCDQWTKVE